MSEHDHGDPSDRARITEEDLFLAGLVGAYADRRDSGQPPRAHDLLARAAELATAPNRTSSCRLTLAPGPIAGRRSCARRSGPRSPARPLLMLGARCAKLVGRQAKRRGRTIDIEF